MTDDSTETKNLSSEELDELAGEELPERSAMSLVNANVAVPVNAAVAANVLSDGSIAYADASQTADIAQGNNADPAAAEPAAGGDEATTQPDQGAAQ